MNWYVEIVRRSDEKVVKRMGPMSERKADRVEMGVMMNLNAEDYWVETKQSDAALPEVSVV